MPPDAEFALLQGKLRSLVEWDVLQFFHHNPHTIEGAHHIATALGRETEAVQTALVAMSAASLVETVETQAKPLFRLTPDPALRKEIEQFMRACDNPTFRRQVIKSIVARATQR